MSFRNSPPRSPSQALVLPTQLVRGPRSGLLSCLFLAGAVGCSPGSEALRAPDLIILISLDTLRADYLGAYGYADHPTSPFLDAFANDNILFENSIIVEPRTLTSHMSLMTGLYPHHHQVQDKTVLADEIPTLASVLSEQGYRTQAFTDGGYMNKRWGFDRGFDGYSVQDHVGFQRILPRAMSWLANQGGERVFLFLHTYDVHNEGWLPEYRSPPPYSGMFSRDNESKLNTDSGRGFGLEFHSKQGELLDLDEEYIRATYAEGVRLVDDELRNFFAFLEREGLYDGALIIVWSDHGEGLYDHAGWSHDEVFEHTIHVPLIMKIPGFEGEGIRIRSVVSAIDLAPTILEVARAPIPPALDGHSLLPLLEDDPREGEAFSLRTKDGLRLFSIRTARYHYIRDERAGENLFFDLEADPKETMNLSPSETPEERHLAEQITRRIHEHDNAWSQGRAVPGQPLDPDLKEELKALGYLN